MTGNVYEEILAMVGQESEYLEAEDEVNEAMIRHWCEAMEDANPLYTDLDYAQASRYHGIIAPPQMVQAHANPRLWPPFDRSFNLLGKAVEKMDQAGYFGVVATSTSHEYFAPMRPGDRINYSVKLKSISPEKVTRLGTGHFITADYCYSNQTGETVCRQSFTILKYKPTTTNTEVKS